MQRRRRHQEEHENHERWLVSYADFITLLFAFFVVMYSISSINEGKYKILSETLTGVFNQPDRSLKPIPIGDERPRTTGAGAHQRRGAAQRQRGQRRLAGADRRQRARCLRRLDRLRPVERAR